jgi:hypothetical protein
MYQLEPNMIGKMIAEDTKFDANKSPTHMPVSIESQAGPAEHGVYVNEALTDEKFFTMREISKPFQGYRATTITGMDTFDAKPNGESRKQVQTRIDEDIDHLLVTSLKLESHNKVPTYTAHGHIPEADVLENYTAVATNGYLSHLHGVLGTSDQEYVKSYARTLIGELIKGNTSYGDIVIKMTGRSGHPWKDEGGTYKIEDDERAGTFTQRRILEAMSKNIGEAHPTFSIENSNHNFVKSFKEIPLSAIDRSQNVHCKFDFEALPPQFQVSVALCIAFNGRSGISTYEAFSRFVTIAEQYHGAYFQDMSLMTPSASGTRVELQTRCRMLSGTTRSAVTYMNIQPTYVC